MANIREATEADFPAMLAMGENMHNESPRYRVHNFSLSKSIGMLRSMEENQACLMLIAEDDGKPVGMLLGYMSEHTFCDGLTANELVVYVTPEARGSSAATRLIRRLEEWGKARGVSEVVLGISTEVDADRTAQFYQRLGYGYTGAMLVKRVSITRH